MEMNKVYYHNNPYEYNNKTKKQDIICDWLIECSKEIKGYKKYTANGYFETINDGLRYNIPVDLYSEEIIKQIDRIFETMPKSYCVKMPEVVYRGIRAAELPEELIDIITLKDKTKNTFTDGAFVSTTENKMVAKSFSDKDGFILKITLPTGTKRIKSEDLNVLMDTEEEVTLPRNSRFRVDSYNNETRTANVTYLGQDYPLPKVLVSSPIKQPYNPDFNFYQKINKF